MTWGDNKFNYKCQKLIFLMKDFSLESFVFNRDGASRQLTGLYLAMGDIRWWRSPQEVEWDSGGHCPCNMEC